MNGFTRGSGCYTCRSCGRKTRATDGNDNEHVRLCVECWEIAGIENQLSDGNYSDYTEKNKLIDEIKALSEIVTSKGGTPNSDWL